MIPDETEPTDTFDALVGAEFDFYGVDNNCFKLDDTIYEAIEDENDGYRSMLETVEINKEDAVSKIFFRTPVARVVLEHVDEVGIYGDHDDIYRLIDLHDGHEWLRFGTTSYDDYYPGFLFDYTPKAPPEL